MDQASIIRLIELSSIVIAAGLGIAGAVTETKDDKGRLTKWGAIAVIGIIISNSFTFIQSYLEQERSLREEIAQMEAGRIRDSIQKVEYLQQIELLYDNIQKSDSSLKQQLLIQSQTSDVLTKMDRSLNVQSSILQQSGKLGRMQQDAAEKIDQTLNPLFPMNMDLTLELRADENTPDLKRLTEFIRGNYKSMPALPDSIGLRRGILFEGNWVELTKSSLKWFLNLAAEQKITIQFDRDKDEKPEVMFCYVPEGFFRDPEKLQGASVMYNIDDNYFLVKFSNIPVRMEIRKGTGFKSTSQLPDSRMSILIYHVPGVVLKMDVAYKFPPDNSVIQTLKQNGTISNMHSAGFKKYYLNYITESVEYAER